MVDPEQQARRDRAAAVNSVPDETRAHAQGDETELVQDAGGALRQPDERDTAEGDAGGDESVEERNETGDNYQTDDRVAGEGTDHAS